MPKLKGFPCTPPRKKGEPQLYVRKEKITSRGIKYSWVKDSWSPKSTSVKSSPTKSSSKQQSYHSLHEEGGSIPVEKRTRRALGCKLRRTQQTCSSMTLEQQYGSSQLSGSPNACPGPSRPAVAALDSSSSSASSAKPSTFPATTSSFLAVAATNAQTAPKLQVSGSKATSDETKTGLHLVG